MERAIFGPLLNSSTEKSNFKIQSMCNSYRFDKDKARQDRVAGVLKEPWTEKIDLLPSELVRRTGTGLILTGTPGELVPQLMRWGFRHPQYREVNNTRASSLRSPFWADSLAERRCLVPMTCFYEWAELPANAPKGMVKPCYRFQRPDSSLLWVAGIFQEFDELGPCYSTITTEPAPPVHPIHDRELAILDWDNALRFLAGETISWTPYSGPLIAAECPSPLRSAKKPGIQG